MCYMFPDLDPFEASDTKYFGPFLGHPLTLQCDPPASYPVPQIFWAIKEANQVLTPVTLSDRVTMDHEGRKYVFVTPLHNILLY